MLGCAFAGSVSRAAARRGIDCGSRRWRVWLDADDQDSPGENEEPTEGYTRWDAGVEYRLQTNEWDLLAFAKFKNISDEEIRLSTSFLRNFAPEAGESVEAGIRYSF